MINMEFLDILYTWRVKEEIKLEKLEDEFEVLTSQKKTDLKISKEDLMRSEFEMDVLKLKIEHQQGVVNRYKTTISSYMGHHNV